MNDTQLAILNILYACQSQEKPHHTQIPNAHILAMLHGHYDIDITVRTLFRRILRLIDDGMITRQASTKARGTRDRSRIPSLIFITPKGTAWIMQKLFGPEASG